MARESKAITIIRSDVKLNNPNLPSKQIAKEENTLKPAIG
jgi:hypothetical protein